MAQVTLSASNSKNVVAIAGNEGYRNRVRALVVEHALNLVDAGGMSAAETSWTNAVLGNNGANEVQIAAAMAVQGDPALISVADTATDAQLRTLLNVVIGRCIAAWAAGQA